MRKQGLSPVYRASRLTGLWHPSYLYLRVEFDSSGMDNRKTTRSLTLEEWSRDSVEILRKQWSFLESEYVLYVFMLHKTFFATGTPTYELIVHCSHLSIKSVYTKSSQRIKVLLKGERINKSRNWARGKFGVHERVTKEAYKKISCWHGGP